MPIYYFDVIVDAQKTQDIFGIELSDLDEARDQAVALLSDVAHDELPKEHGRDFACEVRDWTMNIVYRCTLIFKIQPSF